MDWFSCLLRRFASGALSNWRPGGALCGRQPKGPFFIGWPRHAWFGSAGKDAQRMQGGSHFCEARWWRGSVLLRLLGLIQLFTSAGRVFWLFPSGYDTEVIGPFVSRNNYAAFVELLLPLALVFSYQDRPNSKAYLVLAAALVASVVASGSR